MSDGTLDLGQDAAAPLPSVENERAEHVENYFGDIVRSTDRWARTLVIAIKREDWKQLGLSKLKYIETYCNPNKLKVPAPIRRELAELFKAEAELTQGEIGAALGVSQRQISEDLRSDFYEDEQPPDDVAGQGPTLVESVEETSTADDAAADYDEVLDAPMRQAEARDRQPDEAVTPDPPSGRYRCIVIDPPWPVEKIERETRPDQGIALDYPTMSLDEIAALPVPDLADPAGCHIYLWVTHKFLPVGMDLFEQWGARYQCLMTWRKNVGITPFSWMYDTEHVLFGRIGTLKLEQLGLRLSFEAPVTRHSAKPDVFYDRVVKASPDPRLELFARQPRDGFLTWGNEVA